MTEKDSLIICIESMLNLLEDRLIRQHDLKAASMKTYRKRCTSYPDACWKTSLMVNTNHQKRKRTLGVDLPDRKILRTSDGGSFTVLRDVTRSNDELQIRNHTADTPTTTTVTRMSYEKGIPLMEDSDIKHIRFNLSPKCKTQLDQWLLSHASPPLLAATLNTSCKLISQEQKQQQQHQLEYGMKHTMHQLKSAAPQGHTVLSSVPNHQQYLLGLKDNLSLFSQQIKEWLTLNKGSSIQTLFPDWQSTEDYVYGMMNYIKAHEMMYALDLVNERDDMRDDIHYAQLTLDDLAEVLGSQLANNGQLWCKMGWWVNDVILNTTKDRLLAIALHLQDKLYTEISLHGYTDMMMDCNIAGLGLMGSTMTLTGQQHISAERLALCQYLVTLHAQWTVHEIQSLEQHPYTTNRSNHMSLRLLRLLNMMTRVLVAYQVIIRFLPKSNLPSMDILASSLADMSCRVVSLIHQQSLHQHSAYTKNIMRNEMLTVLYLERSLVKLADEIVELHGIFGHHYQEYKKRIKWLHNITDDVKM